MADLLQTADLFVHASTFTKCLLDNVLITDIQKLQNIPTNKLKQCIKACDALLLSLQKFKQKTSVISNCDKELKNKREDEQLAPNLTELCEFLCKKHEFSQYIKPYYCKLCFFATYSQYEFNNHFISKKHLEKTSKLSAPPTSYKCKVCLMLLIAPESEISTIISHPAHCQLDEHVKKLKENHGQAQNQEDIANINRSNGNVNSVPPKKVSFPEKVAQVFKKKILFKDAEKPHYCHMCDTFVNCNKKFLEHCSSKEHIAAVNTVIITTHLYKCEKCGFLILADREILDEIIYSEGHHNYDAFVTSSRISKDNEAIVLEKKLQPSNSRDSAEPPVIKKFSAQLKKLTDKLKSSTDLEKNFVSCCVLCKKIFHGLNDIKQHLASKKHKAVTSSTEESSHCCDKCCLLVYGTSSDITKIVELPEHIALDNKVQHLLHKNNDHKNIPLDLSIPSPMTKLGDSNSIKELTLDNISLSTIAQSLPPLDRNEDTSQQKMVTSVGMEMLENIVKDKSQSVTPLSHQDVAKVPEKFLIFSCKLQLGNSTKYGFCRVCKKEINTECWPVHVNSNRHLRAKSRVASEDTIERCVYCPLEILGDQAYGNLCLDFHIKLNHNKDEVNNLQIKSIVSKNEDSLERNSETSDKSKSPEAISANNNDRVSYEFFPTTKPLSFEEFLHSKKDNNGGSIKVTNQSVDLLEIFLCFLNKRKSVFIDEGIKKFGALCLFCKMVFEDYLEWLIHIREHRLKNKELDIVERSCHTCNFSLYGIDTLVNDQLWKHQEHLSLDSLILQ